MASISAIAFNLVGSFVVFSVSMILFGCAVKNQNKFVAPRCAARPPAVIYNPSPGRDPCQDRGSPTFGWIPWAMGLTYETMLRGVPGTGTRNDGLSGALLKVNLDGIVLLRFHHLCLRVCIMACFLYLVVVLPLYLTAQCRGSGEDDDSLNCDRKHFYATLDSYERLTLANIPILKLPQPHGLVELISNLFLPVHNGLLVRLYVVVFVAWMVTFYSLRELETEWGDGRSKTMHPPDFLARDARVQRTLIRLTCVIVSVLALRRVYYLEADLWKDRKEELEQMLVTVQREKTERGRRMQHSKLEKDESHLFDRKPWIPHPEQRDTVPNIELYSVLVGGLPSLPTSVFDQDEDGAVLFSRKQSIDWQLSVTTAFFDHCVPNQPGFSSSIAAVTVLPSASHLTEAWNQWYRVAAKLRRLRFIRNEIEKRIKKTNIYAQPDIEQGGGTSHNSQQFAKKSKRTVATNGDEEKEYFQEILGSTGDLQVEDKLLYALNFGPEQIAVYAREFALGAANLAPYGWHERRVLNASLSELIMMERAAVEAVHEANTALREAQERIGDNSSDRHGGDLSDDKLHEIMRKVETSEFNSLCDDDSEKPLSNNSLNSGGAQPSRMSGGAGSIQSVSNRSFFSAEDELSIGERNSRGAMLDEYETDLKGNAKTTNARLRTSFSSSSLRSCGSTSDESGSVSKRTGRSSSSFETSARRNQMKSKASSSRLLGNLGLEAGLWMEQRSAPSDRRAPRGTKSALGNSMHGLHGRNVNRHSPRPRTKSFGEIDVELNASPRLLVEATGSIPIKRALSSDAVDVLAQLSESEDTKSAPIMQDDGSGPLGLQIESIWERLLKDQNRRQNIRDRLSFIQNAETVRSSVETDEKFHENVSTATTDDCSAAEQARERQLCTDFNQGLDNAVPQHSYMNPGITNHRVKSQTSTTHSSFPKVSITPRKMKSLNDEQIEGDLPVDLGHSFTGKSIDHGSSFQGTMEDCHFSFSSVQVEDNLRRALDFEQKAGLRHRDVGASSAQYEVVQELDNKWTRVKAIVQEAEAGKSRYYTKDHVISTGAWTTPNCTNLFGRAKHAIWSGWTYCTSVRPPELVDELVRDSSYAVITFTSRQAAVAARHCLSDSRGHNRWNTVSEIPSPPLADAPIFNMSSFRGCVRPVSLSISDKQKMIRHTLAIGLLGAIYFFYTIPLTLAQQLVSPENLSKIFPDIEELQKRSILLSNIFSGLIPALVWTIFFAACPPMFKIIANFGSNATSSATAEGNALQYFWWFMLLSAFTGTSFSTAAINGFTQGLNLASELQKVIETTAATIPRQVSASWLNWMIIRVFAILPTQYLLQLNTFFFDFLGLQCCARTVRGGGAGGPVPYRIYVDSGVVMLCVFALAPASPLIAASALAYFVFCIPMLRWTLIFLYRPKFDIGGGRFPFIFDVCITGIIAGQIFLTSMMVLKRAMGPAIAAFCPMIPTIWFRYFLRKRYLRAFSDAALLQTSLLDGWDTNTATSKGMREEFRKFLVDCHKAAYVPVCIAGDQTSMITAEPAVVVPVEFDDDDDSIGNHTQNYDSGTPAADDAASRIKRSQPPHTQNMPMMRRARVHEEHLDPASPLRYSASNSSGKKLAVMKEHHMPFLSPIWSSNPKSNVNGSKMSLAPVL